MAAPYRNLPPLRISPSERNPAGQSVVPIPSSPPSPFTSSAMSTPRSSSAWDCTTSPSSSCPSTPFSYCTPNRADLHEPLIPGLPDDLSLACLLRLPLASQAAGRRVCRSWQRTLSNSAYFRARRSNGLAEPWLVILGFHKGTGKIQWQAYDPIGEAWYVLPPMPGRERVCPPGFSIVAVPEYGSILVCGGLRSDMDCPLDSVLKFELSRNKWVAMEPMTTARSFFATGLINGKVYAAGGNGSDSSQLSSTEMYSVSEDRWCAAPDMSTEMLGLDSVVLDEKLYVTEGFSWPYLTSPQALIFDPKRLNWENMPDGMRDGWTGHAAVLNERLYNVPHQENSRVSVFDPETDSWSELAGAPIPSHMIAPFSVVTMENKLLVIARSLHIASGTISALPDGNQTPAIDWQHIHAPAIFSDFTPSHSLVLYA